MHLHHLQKHKKSENKLKSAKTHAIVIACKKIFFYILIESDCLIKQLQRLLFKLDKLFMET